jgi:uncharacterized protein involved in outer membrane biogenesis
MKAAALTAKVSLRHGVMCHLTLKETETDVELNAGRLTLKVRGEAPGGRTYSADLSLDGAAKPPNAALRLIGDKLLIEPLVAMIRVDGPIRGNVDVSAQLKTRGNSMGGMAAALQGDVVFLVERAEADVKGRDRLAGGVNALVGQLVTPSQALAKVNRGLAACKFSGGRSQVKGLLEFALSPPAERQGREHPARNACGLPCLAK